MVATTESWQNSMPQSLPAGDTAPGVSSLYKGSFIVSPTHSPAGAGAPAPPPSVAAAPLCSQCEQNLLLKVAQLASFQPASEVPCRSACNEVVFMACLLVAAVEFACMFVS